MQNFTIKNRNGVNLAVRVRTPENSTSLAFVVHGLGGFKEQIHIIAIADVLFDAGYTVVTHDAANTLGESGGKMEDATLTNYFEDFTDVVDWAKTQSFYSSPFIISGHSLGGACSLLYAARHPSDVKAIAPVSAFIGGEDYRRRLDKASLKEWRDKGFKLEESKSKPGITKKINWSFMEDALTYNLVEDSKSITAPILLITGSEDTGTPESSQRLIAAASKGNSEVHVIQGMAHNPRSKEHINELSETISNWLSSLVE